MVVKSFSITNYATKFPCLNIVSEVDLIEVMHYFAYLICGIQL